MAAAMPQSLWLSEKANTLEARLSLALLVERTGKPEAFRTDCGIAALILSQTNQVHLTIGTTPVGLRCRASTPYGTTVLSNTAITCGKSK